MYIKRFGCRERVSPEYREQQGASWGRGGQAFTFFFKEERSSWLLFLAKMTMAHLCAADDLNVIGELFSLKGQRNKTQILRVVLLSSSQLRHCCRV